MYKLVCTVGQDDTDILPFFLSHYRSIGVGEFHIFLHGQWTDTDLAPLWFEDVVVAGIIQARFDEAVKSSILETYARRFNGEWLVIVEADEFLELPLASLDETVATLLSFGISELPATLLQRAASDGRLPGLSSAVPFDTLFPCFDFRLAERMNVARPIQKTKYPLARVDKQFSLLRGNRLPHTGRPSTYMPIRAVLHHFKWRDRLIGSIEREFGVHTNMREEHAYRHWLQEHDFTLPTEGLKHYSRDALFKAGHFTRPTRSQAAQFDALKVCRSAQWKPAEEQSDALSLVEKMPTAAEQVDDRALSYLERRWLLTPPGRIALVTAELAGMLQTGGIGTAMSALAERLSGAGHEVHLLYCPFFGPALLEPYWIDYWQSRGIRLHYLPRKVDGGRYAPSDEFSLALCRKLQLSEWDVIHFHELGGYAAGALLLRAAGLAFQDTQIAVTAHGPSLWHRRGNSLPWNRDEALQSELEATSVDLADVVICPSLYMLKWLQLHFPGRAAHLVVPNSLTGETRRFEYASAPVRRIQKIAFFGRAEFRKGIDTFVDAIERVLASGISDFEVVFLGRADGTMPDQLADRISRWTCKTQVIANYANHEAIDLLRTESCLVVLPSRVDNLPYTVYECLENGIPFLASDVGGIPELVRDEDRARVLVSGGAEEYAARIIDALTNGVSPVQPRFDPTLADFDLLALHGRLVHDARVSRGSATSPAVGATVIVHGADPVDLEGPLARLLWRWAGDDVEIVAASDLLGADASARIAISSASATVANSTGGAALNRLARSASSQHLLFCDTSVVPRAEALSAMLSALLSTGADAVVCGYETIDDEAEVREVPVFGGPPEFSVDENVYGARIFLTRKESFLEAGGFAEDLGLSSIVEWEFLNRLKAAGKRIVGVPVSLAALRANSPVALNEFGRARLASPWIEAAPERLQGFLSMALRGAGQASPAGFRQLRAGWTPVQQKPVRAEDGQASQITPIQLAPRMATINRLGETLDQTAIRVAPEAQERLQESRSLASEAEFELDSSTDPAPPRIGRDGRLLDMSATYVVRTAEDAEACDFLVADELLSPEHCAFLATAFGNLALRTRMNGSGRSGNRYLWLQEILAADPMAGQIMLDALERAMGLTRAFYCVDAPMYPSRLRIVEVPAGSFTSTPVPVFKPNADTNGAEQLELTGRICLSKDFEGGEAYFTGLDIAVEPKRGRFIATTGSSHHDHAVLRVNSGAQLMMTFSMSLGEESASSRRKRLS